MEDVTHDNLVKFQAHIRGWLGRKKKEKLELQHAATHVIQRNMVLSEDIGGWAWWRLLSKASYMILIILYIVCT